ncbi:hypothetical protein EBR96_01740, partial [bacterium]|nr:hypothetical protein [bacterium]
YIRPLPPGGAITFSREGLYFACFKLLPDLVHSVLSQASAGYVSLSPQMQSGFKNLVSGLLCGVTTQPLDVAKTRVQASVVKAGDIPIRFAEGLKRAVSEFGVPGLFRGFILRSGKIVVTFVCFPMLLEFYGNQFDVFFGKKD